MVDSAGRLFVCGRIYKENKERLVPFEMYMSENQLTLIILGLTAFIMLAATIAAWRSSNAAGKMVYTQTIWQILDAYSSNEMLRSMRILEDWKTYWDKLKENHGTKFLELKNKQDERINDKDEARRHYYHHFYKIKQLIDAGILQEKHLEVVTTPKQIEFLVNVVEPMDDKTTPNYDDSTYRYFDRFFGIKRN